MKQGKCINCGESYLSYTSRRKYCSECQDIIIIERTRKAKNDQRKAKKKMDQSKVAKKIT